MIVITELRLEEEDSVLLSALAIVPEFGEGLLDRMVLKQVSVDAIYYEYKFARDMNLTRSPFKHLFCQSSPRDHHYQPSSSSSPYHVNGYSHHDAPHHVATNGYHPTEEQVTNFPDPETVFADYCTGIARHGVKPSHSMNNAVIIAFLRVGREERAKEVFTWMVGEGLDVSSIHITLADYCIFLLFYYCQIYNDACFIVLFLFSLIRVDICTKRPDIAAMVMLQDMPRDGLQPTLNDLNKVVSPFMFVIIYYYILW